MLNNMTIKWVKRANQFVVTCFTGDKEKIQHRNWFENEELAKEFIKSKEGI